jgi:hypothetical protein
MAMLAVNVSNPDRPNTDRTMAQSAIELAKETLKSFGASKLLSCRVWTVFGSVYGNFGDWPAIRESLEISAKFGEMSVGAVDFGLIAYVGCPGVSANDRAICYMG